VKLAYTLITSYEFTVECECKIVEKIGQHWAKDGYGKSNGTFLPRDAAVLARSWES